MREFKEIVDVNEAKEYNWETLQIETSNIGFSLKDLEKAIKKENYKDVQQFAKSIKVGTEILLGKRGTITL